MIDAPSTTRRPKPIDAVICIDGLFYRRYRAVLRHLCVGLIDVIPRVRLVSSSPEAESLSLGPVQTVTHEPLHWPLRTHRFRSLAERLAKTPPTIVHAMSAPAFDVAERLAAEFDADMVYQITALKDVFALRHSKYTGPRRIICASTPLVERVVKMTHEPPESIALIRPGVICAAGPTCFRDDTRETTILSTASLISENAMENFLRAVHDLRSRGHQFLTFLLGSGPEESRLRQITRKLHLESAVVFAEPEGDVLGAMIGADIFVQPAAEDSISARSLQALAQGMAVVGVAGGVHDAYLPDETAVVVANASPAALAAGIERFLGDHELAHRLGAAAIKHMRQYHTMTAMAEKTGDVYQSLAVNRTTIPIGPRSSAPPP